jgi:hypothetical protein
VVPSVDDRWTDQALRKFRATDLRAIRIVRRVMDILVEAPGQRRPTSELRAALDPPVDPASFKAAWTHLSRHIRAEYGHGSWPLKAEWGPKLGEALSEAYYWVTEERAAQWLRLREEGQ